MFAHAEQSFGNRPVEIKVTGIRPGEKIDEIMVSEEEAYHCVKRGNYYAILPMLPELHVEEEPVMKALEKEFSSADKVLDLNQTIELLKRNKLMIDDGDLAQGEELLR
ncbi:MAG: polysaccharide biosynthesis protein [Proteobacteria bacterium]|nr:polysaccharide biosynthesis protein [Pseudomonadota bacterium]MBU1571286.1 polysaccharide biosynthesis protein [Pseudomonadota bacterium]